MVILDIHLRFFIFNHSYRNTILSIQLKQTNPEYYFFIQFDENKQWVPILLVQVLQMSGNGASIVMFNPLGNCWQIWLVGDGLTEEEQRRAPKGTRFIPFSQFPPKKERKDCVYYSTPAMGIPKALEDMHACEVSPTSLDYLLSQAKVGDSS